MSGYFGRGKAIGHAGEILQGAVRRGGKVEPFLVTLPVPEFVSVATVRRAAAWSVAPGWKVKALRAAEICVDGPLEVLIESEIPAGRGCGSSTADCVAVVRAVADLLGVPYSADEIGRMVQRAEGASDSTMFGMRPVAFLPRAGEVLQVLGEAWPEFAVEVVDMGGPDVCTLESGVPDYSASELDEFEVLLDALRVAIAEGDVDGIGAVALRSAAIQQSYRPHAAWEAVRDGAMTAGAAGVAIAHSGTVAAVLKKVEVACPSI